MKAKEKFFETEVTQRADPDAAIIYLIGKILKKLIIFEVFMGFIQWVPLSAKDFIDIAKSLIIGNDVIYNYSISGLRVLGKFPKRLVEQWNYWFWITNIPCRHFDIVMYRYEVRAVIKSPPIKEALEAFFNNPYDIKAFLKEMENRIYLLNIFPGSYGMTSYNLNIYIGIRNGFDDITTTASYIVTLIHEFGHVIPRYFCRQFKDIKKTKTPPKNNIFTLRNSSNQVVQTILSCGEGGFNVEEMFFGKRVEGLSLEACRFLIDAKKYPKSLTEFRQRFLELNVESDYIIEMNRPANSTFGGRVQRNCI